MKDFSEFESISAVSFKNKDLLKQAFLHRSYLNEHPEETLGNNERLEFLGDAVLELVVTGYLFNRFPEKPEGELTAYRAALVNTQSISEAARRLSMNNFLLLSKGEARDTGKARDYILANTFESVIGAIYLDCGYEEAYEFIKNNLFPQLDEILENGSWQDAKSKFQERAQEHEGITPVYNLLEENGPDHAKNFIVGVYLGDVLRGEGGGGSKQQAEQEAALDALKKSGWE
ncbi:MAG: ribonuclease III [Candidatus Paceibacterota bacterium]